MNKDERLLKLKNLMKDINKGQKDIVLDFASNQESWVVANSGVPIFDDFCGGFPYGHTSIVWGGSGAGKSSLMYSTMTQAQKEGKIVAFLDLENSYSNERASLFGVKTDELIIGHYEVAEKALDTVITLAKEKAVDMIILDSLHSMAPKGELEDKKGQKSLENDTMALLARKLAQFFRMASTLIYNANISFILIGQTRTDLGGFIALQKLSGGNSLIHSSVLTVYMRRGQKSNAPILSWKEAYIDPDGKFHLITKKEPVGFEVVAKIDKKKTNQGKPEGSDVSFPYYLETGFVAPDSEGDIIKIAPEMIGEQKEECRKILVERGYTQFDKEPRRDVGKELDELLKDVPETDDELPDEENKELSLDEAIAEQGGKGFEELEKIGKEEKPKKSKRGRPKKNADTP